MTLEEIYYVSQSIAAIAIIGSLAVLIGQNIASQKLVRAAAVRAQIEGLQNVSRALFETPGLANVWVRGLGKFDQLSNEDRVRFTAFGTYTLRIWEGLYAQFRNGKLDGEIWRGHILQLRDVQNFEGPKKVWELRGHTFSEAFREFYESNLSQGTAHDIYGLTESLHAPLAETESLK